MLFPHPHQIHCLCLWRLWTLEHPCLSHLHHLFWSLRLSHVRGVGELPECHRDALQR